MSKKIIAAVQKAAKIDYQKTEAVLLLLRDQDLKKIAELKMPIPLEETVKKLAELEASLTSESKVTSGMAEVKGKFIRLIVAGCGCQQEAEAFRAAAGNAVRLLQQGKYKSALVAAPILLKNDRPEFLQAVIEGLYLGNYEFNVYKSQPPKTTQLKVTVLTQVKGSRKILQKASIISEAVNYVRELVNEPGNVLTPAVFAQEAKQIAEQYHMGIEILDEAAMAHKKMGALLAVGQGSMHGARMITLKYHGGADKPCLALVGKGITFDSGGISLKPDDNMGEMKDDMTGAGDVLGAMRAIAALHLPVNVLGIMACAENMPSGSAQRPGDIIRSASGKTIEVISTDAEGRMVLADGVWYAGVLGADEVVSIATLTGAVSVALGKSISAIISNNDRLAQSIKDSGTKAGEGWWQLPILPDLEAAIKSEVADVKNSGGRPGGCITGGLFVGTFVKKGLPWAHLDIGGTSTAVATKGKIVKGGTGFGTATLIALAESQI